MLKVKDIMTTDLFVMDEEQNLALVRSLMQAEHIRHVPIVDSANNFTGLLTHRDLLAFTISMLAGIDESEQNYIDEQIQIKNVMKTDVVTTDPKMRLQEALEIIINNKYGCLPVVSDGKLVGIITEADFLTFTYDLLKKIDR